jgi:hypothetical protein
VAHSRPDPAAEDEDRPVEQPDGRAEDSSRLHRAQLQHVGAFVLYLGLWLVAMGPKILTHLGEWTLSSYRNETSVFVWSLGWWAHPFSHGLNPLLSNAIWVPAGLNLAWVTTAPAPSFVSAPLTLAFGPVVSFNVLSLLTPPLTAWTAYLLCRHVSRSFPAGLMGGLLFGFSPVVMREIEYGHLNLSMLFLLPLIPYVVVRRVEGSLGHRAFVAVLAALVVGEFGIFTETFATMTLVGVLIGVVAWALADGELQRRLVDTAKLVAVAYGIALLVVSPYLYTAFAHPQATKPEKFEGLAIGARKVSDLVRFVAPGPGFAIGPGFHGRPDLNWWYFGVALLLLLVLFCVVHWRTYAARLLGAGFLICFVLALGAKLPLSGNRRLPLPWTLLSRFPLLGKARPGRLMAYAFLLAAVSLALWLAWSRHRSVWGWLRWALAVAAVVAVVPNVSRTQIWTQDLRVPSLFTTSAYRSALCPGEAVLVVDRNHGTQAYWQAETSMFFRTATWYVGFRPAGYEDLLTAIRIAKGDVRPSDGPALMKLVHDHGITAVLLRTPAGDTGRTLASLLGVAPSQVDGVTILRLAPCRT